MDVDCYNALKAYFLSYEGHIPLKDDHTKGKVFDMKYKTKGTCSQLIDLEVDGDVISSVSFTGGCNGNLKGIAALVKGMEVDEAISRLKGIRCGLKSTSCPDQLAHALEQYRAQTAESDT